MSGDSIRSTSRDSIRFSSWIHLVRLHARVRRVIHNMLNPENRQKNKELLPEEIRDAEEKIVQRAQQEALKGMKPWKEKSQFNIVSC